MLSAAPPFDLLKSLTCLGLLGIHVRCDRLDEAGDGAALRLPLDVGRRTVMYELRQGGTAARPTVVARPAAGGGCGAGRGGAQREAREWMGCGEGSNPEGEREVERQVARQLEHLIGPSDVLDGFYAAARADPSFWRRAGTLEGLHRVGFATPLEGLCWTILRQRQYPNVAQARLRRLRERFGTPLERGAGSAWAFPAPAVLASAPLDAIRREVKSRKKARFLREAAVALDAMGDALDVLHHEPERVEERLLAIRGVGPWTARTFMARAFSRPHVGHVVADGRVTPYWRDVLARFYGPDIDPALVRERADHYGRWEGYWLFYAQFTHLAMRRALDGGTVRG